MTPVVETGRLRLRGRTSFDFPAFVELWNDPSVYEFTTTKPSLREDLWLRFGRQAGLWALNGYGLWLVEEKATGDVIGEIGCADFKRDMNPPLDGMPEFGWVLRSFAQGKGYATEGVTAALGWALAKFPGSTFCCTIDPRNTASLRVAEKCGFREARRSLHKDRETVVLLRG